MKNKQIYTYCMCGAFLVCALVNATQGAMLTSYINQYSLLSSAQGVTSSAQSIGQGLSILILLSQAGKIGKPAIVAIAFTSTVVILFAISLIPSFVLLAILYCLFGIMFGATNSTTSSLVADMYAGGDTSKYMSRLHGFYGLGGLVAPLIYMLLFDAGFYWNIIIRITAGAVAVLLIIFFFLSRRALKNIELPESSNRKISLRDFGSFFRSGTNILLFFSMFFYAAHQSVFVVWLIRFVSVFLESPALGSLSMALFWAGITISRLFIHRLIPAPPIKVVLFGNLAAGAVIFAGVISGSAIAMACCAFIAGFSNGTSIPSILAVGCSDNHGNTALPTNVFNLALFLAFASCPLVVGAMVSNLPMSSGMYLSAFSALLSGILVICYCRKKRKPC